MVIIIVRKHKGKIDHRTLCRYRFSLEEKCVNWWWINKRRELCSGSQRNEFLRASGDKQFRVLRWSLTIWETACETACGCIQQRNSTHCFSSHLTWELQEWMVILDPNCFHWNPVAPGEQGVDTDCWECCTLDFGCSLWCSEEWLAARLEEGGLLY